MKRFFSLMMTFVMVFTTGFQYPIVTEAYDDQTRVQTNMVADEVTYLDWERSFGKDAQDTSDVGRIWTNKSVWNGDAQTSDGSITIKRNDNNNFLVGLSVISSNKEILGEESLPVDVVFVLDMSSSMDAARVTAMTSAANSAIDKLLSDDKMHKSNRVGVVTYNNSTTSLLSLDTYEKGNSGQYLQNPSSTSISVVGDLKDSKGNTVQTNRVNVAAATNIQAGIRTGADMLINSNEKDVDGVKRIPILVVMSDGVPTTGNSNYLTGTGGSAISSRHDRLSDPRAAFFTQLTGEYCKKEITNAYSRDALVYTLGLAVGQDGRASLNPTGDTSNYSDTFNEYLNAFNAASQGGSYSLRNGNNTQSFIRYNDGGLNVDTNQYNDSYFESNTADGLGEAFDSIIQEIIIQSRYYPTDNDTIGGNQNISGYVTFEDEIAPYMEVKKMNGLLIDNNFQDGSIFAKGATNQGDSTYQFGTKEDPNSIGTEFIKSLKDRLNISDTNEIYELIENAYADGQIAFSEDGDYSNYMAWYADAEGNYLAPAKKDKSDVPENATSFNRSYFFLSKMRVQNSDTSLMYITARVEGNLADGTNKVVFEIPSSLLPLVMYNAEINGSSIDNSEKGFITRTKAYPARLFYEVGLKNEVNEFNVSKVVGDSYPYKNGKTYSFYSNAWEQGDVGKTVATFKPNEQNEYYYFVKNTTIYTDEACTQPLKSEPIIGSKYYYKKNIFTIDDKNESGEKKPTQINHVGVQIADTTLFDFTASDGSKVYDVNESGEYYIKIGTPKGSITYHQKVKNNPATDTATNSIYPVLGYNDSNEPEITVYHGNNGRLQLEQQSGIMVEKQFTGEQVNPAPDQYFVFTIQLGNVEANQAYNVTYFTQDGHRTDSVLTSDENNKITFSLRENARIYIVLPVGTTYSVTENELPKDYFLDHIDKDGENQNDAIFDGTVTDGIIDEGIFFNKYEESIPLTVQKEVSENTYGYENNTFDFVVEVNGIEYQSFALLNKGEKTINVPKSAVINVTEQGAVNYDTTISAQNGTGTADNSDKTWTIDNYQTEETVTFTNTYAADTVTLSVEGVKTLVGRDFYDSDNFEFVIVDTTNDKEVAKGKMTGDDYDDTALNGHSKKIVFDELSFDHPGEYKYSIREIVPTEGLPGISYDSTRYTLTVTVTEKNDGTRGLEISSQLENNRTGSVVDEAKFVNNYSNDELNVVLQINKIINNPSGADVNYKDFEFTAHDEQNGNDITGIVGTGGIVRFQTGKITQEGTYKYTIKETTGRLAAIDYDKTVITAVVEVKSTGDETDPFTRTITYYYGDSAEGNLVTGIPVLTNTVVGNESESVTLSGTKTLNGRDILASDGFEFTIAPSNENGVITGASEKMTFAIDETDKSKGILTWDKTFDKVGTYYYVVSETEGNVAGITYDSKKYLIQVDVTHDLTDTQLDASAKVIKVAENGTDFTNADAVGNNGLDFENTYTPPATDVVIPLEKVINDNGFGRGWQDDDSFNFVLEETDENFVAKNLIGNISLTKDKQKGEFVIKIDKAGVTYYRITENTVTTLPGFEVNDTVYKVKVTAVSNKQTGLLETRYELVDATGDIVFTNEYNALPTKATIVAQKTFNNLTNYTGKSITDFKFVLKDENGNVVADASPKSNGSISFETPSLKKVGTYKYTIEEVDGKDGISYDPASYTAIVEVKDDHKGQLYSMVTYETDDQKAPVFTNTLEFDPISIEVNGEKTLTGKTLKADEFTFSLTESNALGEISDTAKPILVKNDKDGNFKFKLNYESLGTFFYVIEEVNDDKAGITYDDQKYLLEVNIKNDKDNLSELKESHKLTRFGETDTVNTVEFTNQYTTESIEATLNLSKTLEGRDWQDDDSFEFKLTRLSKFLFFEYDKSSETYVITNKDDLVNVFEGMKFDEGTYTFELEEIEPEDSDPTLVYDSSKYRIVLEVVDTNEGYLESKVTVYDKDGKVVSETKEDEDAKITFINKYMDSSQEEVNPPVDDDKDPSIPDKKPVDKIPETGDNANMTTWAVLMFVSFSLLAGVFTVRKSRKSR